MARKSPRSRSDARKILASEERDVETHGLVGGITGTLAGLMIGGAAGGAPAAFASKKLTEHEQRRLKAARDTIESTKPRIARSRAEVMKRRKKGK